MRSQFLPGLSLASVLAGVIAGVALASWVTPFAKGGMGNIWVMALSVALLFTVIIFFTRREETGQKVFYVFLAVVGLSLGYLRYESAGPGEHSVKLLEGNRTITAIVRSQEADDKSQNLVLRDIQASNTTYDGGILATVARYPETPVGAKVSLQCEIEIPEVFDGFAYDRFLAAKRIYATCRTQDAPLVLDAVAWPSPVVVLDKIHRSIVRVIHRTFGEPQAGLLAGLLLGDNDFSDAWRDRFVATGTSHIVAASGTNVAIVASVLFVLALSLGLRRQEAFPLLLFGIVTFVIVAGAEAAVTRAGIMAALVLIAKQSGRKTSPRNILLLTVAGMLLIEPRLLRDDVGFQLSVASTIGLLWFSKPFSERLFWIPETLGLRESLATTLAATLATLPVVLIAFGRVVFVGPIANLFVLPFLPYAMAFGSVATLLGAVQISSGALLAAPAWVCLTAILELIRAFAAVPELYSGIALVVLLLFFAISFRLPAPIAKEQDSPRRLYALLLPLVLFLLVAGILLVRQLWLVGWPSLPKHNDVTVWVFDVGQGDGIFIDGPERDVVLDGGPSSAMVEKVSSVLPWWDRSIDTVINTHPHADHLVGLVPLLERYKVDEVLDADQGYGTPEFEQYLRTAGDHRRVIKAGEVIELGGGATLTAVWPIDSYNGEYLEDPNDGSVMLLLEAEGKKMLFTGDAGVEQERALLQDYDLGDIDVLKIGHHGSDTSTSSELLAATTPEDAIISVGEGNTYGHPSKFVVANLLNHGIEVWRTDLQGDIRVKFADDGVMVKSFVRMF